MYIFFEGPNHKLSNALSNVAIGDVGATLQDLKLDLKFSGIE